MAFINLPGASGGGASDLDGLTDVDTTTTSPTEGDVLVNRSGIFVPEAASGGSTPDQEIVWIGWLGGVVQVNTFDLAALGDGVYNVEINIKGVRSGDVQGYSEIELGFNDTTDSTAGAYTVNFRTSIAGINEAVETVLASTSSLVPLYKASSELLTFKGRLVVSFGKPVLTGDFATGFFPSPVSTQRGTVHIMLDDTPTKMFIRGNRTSDDLLGNATITRIPGAMI